MQIRYSVLAGLVLLLGLSGCGTRQRLTLQPVTKARAHSAQQKEGVEVLVRRLSQPELREIVHKPLAMGNDVHALALTVHNHTQDKIVLDKKWVDLPWVPASQINHLLVYTDGPRPLTVLAYVMTPLAIGTGFGLVCGFGEAFAVGVGIGAIVCAPFALIDAVAYAAVSSGEGDELLAHNLVGPGASRTVLLLAQHIPEMFAIKVLLYPTRRFVSFDVCLPHPMIS